MDKQLAAGRDVILEIEIQGALTIKERFPSALLLFVTPPSIKELRRRLSGRGTETQEVIDARLRRAAEEAEGIEAYDYLVVNDDLDACVGQMHMLIQGAHSAPVRQEAFIDHIRSELEELVKGEN